MSVLMYSLSGQYIGEWGSDHLKNVSTGEVRRSAIFSGAVRVLLAGRRSKLVMVAEGLVGDAHPTTASAGRVGTAHHLNFKRSILFVVTDGLF